MASLLWTHGDFVTPSSTDFIKCALDTHFDSVFGPENNLVEKLRDGQFDMALLDLKGNEFGLALCHAVNIPVASFWGFPFEGNEALYTSNVRSPAVSPAFGSRLKSNMGFLDRARNFFISVWNRMVMEVHSELTRQWLAKVDNCKKMRIPAAHN